MRCIAAAGQDHFSFVVSYSMLMIRRLVIVICLSLFTGCTPVEDETPGEEIPRAQQTVQPGLEALFNSYPDFFTRVLPNHIEWADGTLMPYNSGDVEKEYSTLLACPDLEDQMSQYYPRGSEYRIPRGINNSPGRIRYYPFFTKMYGATAAEVKVKLAPVVWLPSSVNKILRVTSINGVDKKLQAVSDELDKLPEELQKYVRRTGGTFCWRNIAGTTRLSAHSFGIAIDINVSFSNYWKWDHRGKRESDTKEIPYKNKIPMEIVEIFEAHGFIWGGKWYHYDTMHFEYRPELLFQKKPRDFTISLYVNDMPDFME
jgi:peptidoglycan LD-endopeptidase CwlK